MSKVSHETRPLQCLKSNRAMKIDKFHVPPEAKIKINDWILELIKSSCLLWGAGDMLGEESTTTNDSLNRRFEIDDYTGKPIINEHRYAFYANKIQLTDVDYDEIVMAILKRVLSNKSFPEVVMSMADSLEVLLDEEKSARWLRPYVGAERTSLAYERGKGLIRHARYALAQAVMQKAADEGDEYCAMYLIEQLITGRANGFKKNYDSHIKDNISTNPKSIEFESACVWIEQNEPARAQSIMQKAADSGDIDCAMYLIEHTLLGKLSEVQQKEHPKRM